MHEHHALGATEAALGHYRQAGRYFRASGDLRRWGAATYSAAWVLRLRGRLADSLELARELTQVGQDGADDHVLAWGLHATGRGLAQAGAVADAAEQVARARELFRGVPDLQFVACTTSDLAHYQLCLGRLDEALRLAEDARRLIAERGFRGFLCTPARNVLAEAYLELAASGHRPVRRVVRQARRACRAAVRQGRLNPEGLPTACRLAGRWQWRYGRRSRALAWWRRGLSAAEALGARYELAQLHHEVGTSAGDPEHLARARDVLAGLERPEQPAVADVG
jgi:tetratricopeptide (TPR) repeat protein